MRAFFDEEKLRQGGKYAEFFSSWKYIAGERAASHSRIADVERGILVVVAEHPGWIQLLQLRQTEILNAVTARFPELELRGIVFRLGRLDSTLPGKSAEALGPFGPSGKLPSVEESPDPERGLRKTITLEDIDDTELKKNLEALKKTIEGGK